MKTFADFVPAEELGVSAFDFDRDAVAAWTNLFPDDAASLPDMPYGMVAMVLMRAFMRIIPQRPPGNIHAGQKFWISRMPKLGTQLMNTLTCVRKELKNERRWVTFASETTGSGDTLFFRGQMITVWAA
jgi:hypothetical protein